MLCQRFFPSRAASGWFEVGRKLALWKSSSNSSAASHRGLIIKANPEARTHLEEVITRHEEQCNAESQPRVYAVGGGSDSLTPITPWLERTQWLSTYKNLRRDLLGQMTVLPTRPGVSNGWTDLVLGQGFRTGEADICSPKQDEAKLACMVNCWLTSPSATMALDGARKKCDCMHKTTQLTVLEQNPRFMTRQNWNRRVDCYISSAIPTAARHHVEDSTGNGVRWKKK